MTTKALLLASTLIPAFAILAPATRPATAESGIFVVAQAERRGDDEEDRRKKEQQQKDQQRKDQPRRPGAQGQPAQQPGAQPPVQQTPSTPPAVQQRPKQERRPAPAAQERRDQPPPAADQQKRDEAPPAARPRERERPARQERPAVQQGQEQPGAPGRRDQRPAPTVQQPAAPQQPSTQTQPPPGQPAPTVQQPAAPQQPTTQTQPTRRGAQPPSQPAPTVQAPADPTAQQQRPRKLEEVQSSRREERQGNRTVIREGDRTIVRESGRTIIRHNETDRFRVRAQDVRVERRGRDTATVVVRPGGVQIVTVVDDNGRLLRRSRRGPDGREVIIIDNRPRMGGRDNYFVVLPPPVIRIPRERYILEAERARPEEIYEVLMEPPVERLPRAYSLDEIRYSPAVRERMPRVDIDTITFETGSWEITPDQVDRLAVIADAIKRAVERNPNEVFLIEGHTDAVGSDVDNLSLSDRRAESVAIALTDQLQIPAENLTTQGYGEQYLKVPTQGPERVNRRVTIRRITPLLMGQNEPQPR